MQVLGYVTCTSAKLALHISKVAVDPLFRRQGIATALLQVRHELRHPSLS